MTEVEVLKSTWVKKGANLSDKSARKEFGLTQEEIIEESLKWKKIINATVNQDA